MTQSRREFLSTSAAAAAAALAASGCQLKDYEWSSPLERQAGWAPEIEERKNSTCLLCPGRCGIRGRVVDGSLVAITGNALHPLNQGGLCPRGVAGVQALYHPQRIAAPVIRDGPRGAGQWRAISGADAVAHIADKLRALRSSGHPERLALSAGYCAGSIRELWSQLLRAYGSPNYVRDEYADGTDVVMGLMHNIPQLPGYDLENSRLVLSFGAPLFESWWSPVQAYAAFGGARRFIQVDTRFSRTAARAHEWIGIPPGTYGVLALGIAYVLIREQAYNATFVARHVAGFEDTIDAAGTRHEGYRSLVLRNFRTEEVSALTGVPVERIVALARSFAPEPGAVAVCGTDVLHSPNGLISAMAVHSLNVLAGAISRSGGVMFGDGPPLAPLVAPVIDATARHGLDHSALSSAGGAEPFGDGDPAGQFASAVARAPKSPVEALFLYYSNPLASAQHPKDWRAALDRIPFIVSFSPFLDETTRFADLVLPDALSYERWQDAPTPPSYPHPVWGIVQPLVATPPKTLPTAEAILAIARALGGTVARSLPYADVPALLQARARGLFEARRGMTFGDRFERTHYRQMEERGWWLAEQTDFDAFWKELVDRGGWTDLLYDGTDPRCLARTARGKVELMPQGAALPRESYAVLRTVQTRPNPPHDFPLRLLPYRVSTLASGSLALEPWLAEQPSLTLDVHWVPWVEVNPATAETAGLADGTMVWVVAPRGRYQARLRYFVGAAPGHVHAPYGPRHADGSLANPFQLLADIADPLTGLVAWDQTFVRLERA